MCAMHSLYMGEAPRRSAAFVPQCGTVTPSHGCREVVGRLLYYCNTISDIRKKCISCKIIVVWLLTFWSRSLSCYL